MRYPEDRPMTRAHLKAWLAENVPDPRQSVEVTMAQMLDTLDFPTQDQGMSPPKGVYQGVSRSESWIVREVFFVYRLVVPIPPGARG